jgi:hypothetical protein
LFRRQELRDLLRRTPNAQRIGFSLGKDARHRRQVADVAVDHAEQRDDRGLVGGDAVEIADDRLL